MSANDKSNNTSAEILVLVDPPANAKGSEIALYEGALGVSAEKLGQYLKEFTSAISQSLSYIADLPADYDLSTITIEAKLNVEVGFVLVSKAGVEGTITLTFARPSK